MSFTLFERDAEDRDSITIEILIVTGVKLSIILIFTKISDAKIYM